MRVRPLVVGVILLGAVFAVAPAPSVAQGDGFCDADHRVDEAGWTFCFLLDGLRGQGLEVLGVRYQDQFLFWRIGFPFAITEYPADVWGPPLKDVLGRANGDGTQPGFGDGALSIDPASCPRWLATGRLLEQGTVCHESGGGPVPATAVWSRFDVQNYRYVQGYVFRADGTLEPKLLLGGHLIDLDGCGVGSGCLVHRHYLYWRLDTDVMGSGNDRFQEFQDPGGALYSNQNDTAAPACSGAPVKGWCTVATEGARVRNMSAYVRWRVVDFGSLNGNGAPRSIELEPGSLGGVTNVSTHDVWVLRWADDAEEIGFEVPANPLSDAAVSGYATANRSTDGKDIVVWYAERILHEPRDEDTPTMLYHEAGPVLRVRNFVDGNAVEVTFP